MGNAVPQAATVTVNIRNLAVGGDGVGEVVAQSDGGNELLGITAFVPFTAVGETVSARIVQRKDRYLKTELLSVDKQSPSRIEARCPYYTNCGGCNLQHVTYHSQLDAKQRMIEGALKAAQLGTEVLESLQSIISGQGYSFRRRIKLHVDSSGRIGFYRAQSRSVVQIASCAVATEAIASRLERIGELGLLLQGKVSSLTIESDRSGVIAVLGAPYTMSDSAARKLVEQTRAFFPNVTLMAAGKEIAGVGRTLLELPLNERGTLLLKVPAGSFSQVNWDVNLSLIEEVLTHIDPNDAVEVIDLYAGAGNFALPLAHAGAKVTAVECDPRLVHCGRRNAQANELERRVSFIEQSVEHYLRRDGLPKGSVVVADPPRSGLSTLVAELHPAKKLLFVSCHLPSFVRDLQLLIQRGWRVKRIQPFDMFAQTAHVELLGVLERV